MAWAVGATSVVGLVFVLGTLHPGALLASLLVGGAVGSLAGKSAGLTSRSAQRLRRRRWFSKHHRAIGRLGDRDAP